MKRTRVILCIVAFILVAVLFSGCQRHFTRSEVIRAIEKRTPGLHLEVSKKYEERQTEPDGYIAHVWTAYFMEYPDVPFEVSSRTVYSMEHTIYVVGSTANAVFAQRCFDTYFKGKETLLTAQVHNDTDFVLYAVYQDKAQLKLLVEQIEGFEQELAKQPFPCTAQYRVGFKDSLGNLNSDMAALEIFSSEDKLDSDAIEKRLLSSFTLYAVQYRVGTENFSDDELHDAIAEHNWAVTILRADGTKAFYPDLAWSSHQKCLSFGTLFELLKREGFSVTGTAQSFRFTGIDGCEYTFERGKIMRNAAGVKTFFYEKDGEQTPLRGQSDSAVKPDYLRDCCGLIMVEE